MESKLQLFKVSLVLLIFISSHFGNLKLNIGSAEAAAVQQRTNGWKDLMISKTEKETLDKVIVLKNLHHSFEIHKRY